MIWDPLGTIDPGSNVFEKFLVFEFWPPFLLEMENIDYLENH